MEQIESTYRDVNDFFTAANQYVQQHEEDNKFRYALVRTLKSAGRVLGEYQDKNQAINIKHCLAEDGGKGAIIREPNGEYKYTKDGLLKRNEERVKLFNSSVKLDVHFCSEAELPTKLTGPDRDAFMGFVIKEKHK